VGGVFSAFSPWVSAPPPTPPRFLQSLITTSAAAQNGVEPIERFNALFAEARDEIEYAREDAETTYFNESVDAAKKAVDEALAAWDDALNNAPDDAARGALQRGSGLKVEQLKAELQALDEIHA
jgi:acetoin utilization deacetylase AcuC-like enzyme